MSELVTINGDLLKASGAGNLADVKRFLAAGANIDTKFGDTPLTTAAQQGRLEVVRFLLDNGADINNTDMFAGTALYNAARKNHVAIVDLLAFRGADVDSKDRDGFVRSFVFVDCFIQQL